MKRFRLSTLMLFVVIAALVVGLATQEMRHRRRDAEQQATIAMQANRLTEYDRYGGPAAINIYKELRLRKSKTRKENDDVGKPDDSGDQ
jgi:hypothetical protein